MLRERNSIANAEKEIDSVLGQALGIQQALANQRNMFNGISTKMRSVADRIPLVNDLMKKIDQKKQRDKYIMALTVGLCFCFLTWWTFL